MSFRRYPEYKDGGTEWLGSVPVHWALAPVKRGYEVCLGKMLQAAQSGEDDVLAPYLRAANIQWGSVDTSDVKQMWFSPRDRQQLALRHGDLLISEGGDVGRSAIWRDEVEGCFIQNSVNRVRSNGGDLTAFLYYWMVAIKTAGYIDVLCNKSTIAHFTAEKVARVPVPYPPQGEQRAIVEFLDCGTAKIGALIAEQENLLTLLAEKRQALISHAVTRGLNPDAPLKDSGIPWLGQVPAHWEIVPFKRCVDFQEGPGILATDFHDDGVPLLRVAGVQTHWATLDGCNYLDPEKVRVRWNHFRVQQGDLLISASASMGTVCEVGEEAVGSIPYTGLIRLRGVERMMLKDFIRYVVVSKSFITQIDLLKAGATIQHFGPTHLSQMVVARPPEEEQVKIAAHLDLVLDRLAELEVKASAAIDLLKERRSALITAAVTGQIDVRGAIETQAA